MKHFHVHVYFEPMNTGLARTFAENARLMDLFESVKFHELPVGPHPTGMIEMQFSEPVYNKVVEWVDAHRGAFSALVHQDTGDDLRDHTDGIRWLGTELPLDFSFFELVQLRPELRIHQ